MDSSACWFPLVTLALMAASKPTKTTKKVKNKNMSKRKPKRRQELMEHMPSTVQPQNAQQWSGPTHTLDGGSLKNCSACGLWPKFHAACHRKIADYLCWSSMPRQLESFNGEIVGRYSKLIDDFMCSDAASGGEAIRQWPSILRLSYPSFRTLDLPRMLLSLILRGYRNQQQSDPARPHDHFCEAFAGTGTLTRECLRMGLRGAAFDWVYEAEEHNMCSSKGVRLVLDCMSGLCWHGLLWVACECSSFTVLCRSVSCRNEQNRFRGNESRNFVATGNLLMCVSSLFYFISWALQVYVVLEQPQNSCLRFCEPICGVFNFTGTAAFRVYLGSYGSPSVKPLSLFTTWTSIQRLESSKPQCESQLVTRDESGAFTGIKDELFKSQEYTAAFARCVAHLLREELGEPLPN